MEISRKAITFVPKKGVGLQISKLRGKRYLNIFHAVFKYNGTMEIYPLQL